MQNTKYAGLGANQQNLAGAQQYATDTCREDTQLETVLGLIQDLVNAASINSDNACALAGKLIGETPVSIGGAKGEACAPSRAGLLGEIRDRLDSLAHHLRVGDGHLQRLRSAI